MCVWEQGHEANIVVHEREITRRMEAVAVPPAKDLCEL
jgi:hypothetical protein